jgi:hypothetical protein
MTLRLKTAVSAFALLPLVACGGGGGGGGGGIAGGAPVTGSSAATSSSTDSGSSTGSGSGGSTTPVAMTTSSSITSFEQTPGGAIGSLPITDENTTVTITRGADGVTPQSMTFEIKGENPYAHTFTLPQDVPLDTFVTVNEGKNLKGDDENVVTFKNLNYSTFGVWQLNNDDGSGVAHAFAQGKETPIENMPKTGTAEYAGSAVARVTNGAGTSTSTGVAAFAADFGKGTISGELKGFTGGDLKNLAMPSTSITGNGYSGTLQSADGTMNGSTAGKFGGPQYNEIFGTFTAAGGEVAAVGAYGATKK